MIWFKVFIKTLLYLGIATSVLCCDKTSRIMEKYKTMNEFKYKYEISDSIYSFDSLTITRIFRQMIDQNIYPYQDDAFDEKTKILVDTLIYSPDGKFISIFIIMNRFNGSMKYIYDMDPNGWCYDGSTFFAEKIEDTIKKAYRWKIFDYHGTDHINGDSYEKISKIVRLENLVGRSYSASKNHFVGFNIDDYRFWESKIFSRYQSEGYIDFHEIKNDN
jgi:hypothetical protein